MYEDFQPFADRLPLRRLGYDPRGVLAARRKQYLSKARLAADMIWQATSRPVTVDQVRAVVGQPPEGVDGRINGAIFMNWRKVYGVNSRRRTCHQRGICGFIPPMNFVKSAFYLCYFKATK
jgi:hypothetical protein